MLRTHDYALLAAPKRGEGATGAPARLRPEGPGALEFASVGQGRRGPSLFGDTSVPGTLCLGPPARGKETKGPAVAVDLLRQKFCIYERHAAARPAAGGHFSKRLHKRALSTRRSRANASSCAHDVRFSCALNRSPLEPSCSWPGSRCGAGSGRGAPLGACIYGDPSVGEAGGSPHTRPPGHGGRRSGGSGRAQDSPALLPAAPATLTATLPPWSAVPAGCAVPEGGLVGTADSLLPGQVG